MMESNNNERRLIIHIGLHKTGTTAIQKFLSINRLVFEKYGIYVPKVGLPGKYEGHHNLAWELHGNTSLFRSKFGTFNDLRKELNEVDYKTVVVSSDHFECFFESADKLKKLKDFADSLNMKTYVFVCFRKETEYIPMIYEEMLKAGLSMNFDDFINSIIKNGKFYFKRYGGWNFCFDYNKLISGFSDVFGKEKVRVFDYIVPAETAFLKLLDIEDDKEFVFPGRVNQPLPSFIVKMLRPYNIIEEKFSILMLARPFIIPIVKNTIKSLVALGLLSKVSSTVKLNSFQRKSITSRFSFFNTKHN